MPKNLVKPCPYLKVCATPGYWGKEKETYIKTVCKTNKHKICNHKQSEDAHYEFMSEERRKTDFKARNEAFLLQRIETYVRGCWTDYLTQWLLKEIHEKKTVEAVEILCKDLKHEWKAQDILKMIKEYRIP